jgi:hypothetical protein
VDIHNDKRQQLLSMVALLIDHLLVLTSVSNCDIQLQLHIDVSTIDTYAVDIVQHNDHCDVQIDMNNKLMNHSVGYIRQHMNCDTYDPNHRIQVRLLEEQWSYFPDVNNCNLEIEQYCLDMISNIRIWQ